MEAFRAWTTERVRRLRTMAMTISVKTDDSISDGWLRVRAEDDSGSDVWVEGVMEGGSKSECVRSLIRRAITDLMRLSPASTTNML